MTIHPTSSAVLNLLASPNPTLRGALHKRVPHGQSLADAMQRCTDERAALLVTVNASDGAWAELIAGTTDAFAAGDTIEFAAKAHAAKTTTDTAETGLRVIDAVEQHLSNRLAADVNAARDTILHDLHAQVVALVAEARKLPLHNIDAEEAIISGHADQWALLTRLRTRYSEIRQAQQAIVSLDIDSTARNHHTTFGWIRNYAEMWPGWSKLSSRHDIDGFGLTTGPQAPWPADEASRFRWLIDTPEAEPWVPTDTELEAVVSEARAEARAKEVRERQQQESGRHVVTNNALRTVIG